MPRRRIVIAALVCVAIIVLGVLRVVTSGGETDPGFTEETVLTEGTRESDGTPVTLDGEIFLPARTPAPAVLLGHGYGGSKDSMRTDALALVKRGFVVLTYSARGFGDSDGKIHLDSPAYEVKDAQRMLDVLGKRSEVVKDGPGDPRVGVAGPSYGGAMALLLAGTDQRVDAVAPSITWNDLRQALFPQFASQAGAAAESTPSGLKPVSTPGVFKKQWTAVLLGASARSGSAPPPAPAPSASASVSPDQLNFQTLGTACGNVDVQLCFGYLQAATTGRPTPELLKLLAASSPARVASRIRVPTLLIQGQTDSLFPLSEGDANARAIAANGAPVQMVWEAGGHDAGPDDSDRLRGITADFFTRTLGRPPGQNQPTTDHPGFAVTVQDSVLSSANADPVDESRSAERYPGLAGRSGAADAGDRARTTTLPLNGGEQLAISPPGAAPAALTSLPGASSALSALSSAGAAASGLGSSSSGPGGAGGLTTSALPGQTAGFETAPLSRALTITGSSRVRVRVTSTADDATLFASLVDVAPDGSTTLPRQLVSPIYLSGSKGTAREVLVTLPAIVQDVPAGHRLRVVFSSTDQGYSLPSDARGYRIALADPVLTVPDVRLTVDADDATRGLTIAAVLLVLFAALTLLGFWFRNRRIRRRTARDVDEELRDVPLALTGLGKAYGDGFRAVSDLSFRVEQGQVLGLLGPNGAGKTTTLRMLMGLILPTEGEIRIFGHQVSPGAAVLSRLGSFIEGPGFLPHLTGLENLTLYWRSTGRRTEDSGLGVALEIAGLGNDVHRKVRTYSQGMRQRLAIAQAMLGLPDLLVLDEPTNGLDPPQIREMRDVLRRYAATGRTVIVSSHLLSEVEQTCTYVVVMLGGRLVAEGTVDELIGSSSATVIEVDDPARAGRIAGLVKGMSDVTMTETGLLVKGSPATRALLVKALVLADIRVDRVAPQRGLEETFLALVGEH